MFYLHLLHLSIRASIARRGAFLTEVSLMILNNLLFYAVWWIFFRQFNAINGWILDDMIALTAVAIGGYGLSSICCGGVRNLSSMIVNGEMDPLMTKPKSPLLQLIGAKSRPKGWGHLFTAAIMILLGHLTEPLTLLLLLLTMFTSCLVFASMAIIAHSLPFWMGNVEGLSKKYCDALFLFTIYPTNIYSGLLQWLMFTLIPAGVIGFIPVELIREFSWSYLAWLCATVLIINRFAIFIFNQGLRRYESGNQCGMQRNS